MGILRMCVTVISYDNFLFEFETLVFVWNYFGYGGWRSGGRGEEKLAAEEEEEEEVTSSSTLTGHPHHLIQ